MKWSEFKKIVDAEIEKVGLSPDIEINYIDISAATMHNNEIGVFAQDGELAVTS